MDRKLIIMGSVLGITAVILGAFGAHGLKQLLDVNQLATFETGVRYQIYHALFLLLVSTLKIPSEKVKGQVGTLILLGTILFSGSIYLLATRPITRIDFSPLGFVTPIGGALLIIGWSLLFVSVIRRKS